RLIALQLAGLLEQPHLRVGIGGARQARIGEEQRGGIDDLGDQRRLGVIAERRKVTGARTEAKTRVGEVAIVHSHADLRPWHTATAKAGGTDAVPQPTS